MKLPSALHIGKLDYFSSSMFRGSFWKMDPWVSGNPVRSRYCQYRSPRLRSRTDKDLRQEAARFVPYRLFIFLWFYPQGSSEYSEKCVAFLIHTFLRVCIVTCIWWECCACKQTIPMRDRYTSLPSTGDPSFCSAVHAVSCRCPSQGPGCRSRSQT